MNGKSFPGLIHISHLAFPKPHPDEIEEYVQLGEFLEAKHVMDRFKERKLSLSLCERRRCVLHKIGDCSGNGDEAEGLEDVKQIIRNGESLFHFHVRYIKREDELALGHTMTEESEEQLWEITDETIQNQWYVRALKQMAGEM